MASTSDSSSTRRKYHRRSEEERIAELERRIEELRAKKRAKEKKDDPVLREIPKIKRRLQKFAHVAAQSRRLDIANSTTAFVAQLDRIFRQEVVVDAEMDEESDEEEFED